MENRIYIDSHLFNFEECMFGGKDENWGTVKFSGDSILNLTDGNVYRCCGVFTQYVFLINDFGDKVSLKANMEWTSGRKKEPRFAQIHLIEDFTKEKLLSQIINDGKEVYPYIILTSLRNLNHLGMYFKTFCHPLLKYQDGIRALAISLSLILLAILLGVFRHVPQ